MSEVSFKVIDIGLTSFKKVYGLQIKLLKSRQFNKISDTLLLTEHPHVFTIGRLGLKSNLLINSRRLEALGIPVYEIDRGGDITYHGPGQLVVYPIFSLKSRNLKIVDYIRNLEESTIRFFYCYGIKAERKKGFTGVWFKDEKIASIGIGIKKWVAYHGIGININTDIEYFKLINPCGIKGVRMTSLKRLLGGEIEMVAVKNSFIGSFGEVFN